MQAQAGWSAQTLNLNDWPPRLPRRPTRSVRPNTKVFTFAALASPRLQTGRRNSQYCRTQVCQADCAQTRLPGTQWDYNPPPGVERQYWARCLISNIFYIHNTTVYSNSFSRVHACSAVRDIETPWLYHLEASSRPSSRSCDWQFRACLPFLPKLGIYVLQALDETLPERQDLKWRWGSLATKHTNNTVAHVTVSWSVQSPFEA